MKESKGRYVFDVEANGLLFKADTIWCVVIKDIDTLEVNTYSAFSKQEHVKPINEAWEVLSNASALIGHNLYMYDIILLNLLVPDKVDFSGIKIVDTLILSQLIHFSRRLGIQFNKHGLEAWGEKFGVPKPKQEQWHRFEEAMINRCQQDVEINYRTYKYLIWEAKKDQTLRSVIKREMKTAEISMKQVHNGWLFDKTKAIAHVKYLDKEITRLALDIEPNLPNTVKSTAIKATWDQVNDALGHHWKSVPTVRFDKKNRPIKLARMPTILKYTKSGQLHATVIKYFDLNPKDPKNYLVWGPFTRVKFEKSTMAQHAQVKKYLLSIGWIPTTWTYEMLDGKKMKDDNGKPIKKSPKLTEDSFDSIAGNDVGANIALHNTLKSRRNTLANADNKSKGWINQVREDGRLVCFPRTIGAATARMTHSGVVNVPGSKAVFGKEMREVFIAPKDRVIVACDMASAQLRLLAAAMGDEEYVRTVVEGSEYDDAGNYIGTDIHSVNGLAAGLIKDHWEPGGELWKAGRARAKTFIYGLLFGAGDGKIGEIVKGSAEDGAKLRYRFLNGLPALGGLIDRIAAEWKANKKGSEGWFEGLDGRRIYCASAHKLLNYKLQSDEAILLKEWLILVDEQLEQANKEVSEDAKFLLSYHDELNFEASPEYADKVGEIMKHCIQRAGQRLGLTCEMDGDYAIGSSWAEVH